MATRRPLIMNSGRIEEIPSGDTISGTIAPGASGIQSNYVATTAPAVSNDNTEGYEVGSYWFDVTNDNIYSCVDASTGAAVWLQLNGAGGASAFLGLSDTPGSFGLEGQFLVVNAATDALEFVTAANARADLGLGTMATQNAAAVTISGGSVSGITDISIADGGTGASNAANARSNLGLAIGSNVQAFNAYLADIAAITGQSTDQIITWDGTNWVADDAPGGLPAGGVEAAVLAKNSATDGDADWIPMVKGGVETPSYANEGGTGDRTALITVTSDLNAAIAGGATFNNMVDGATGTNVFYTGDNVVGHYIRFQFTEPKSIEELKWYMNGTYNHATVKAQGSNDGTTWTDLSTAKVFGGTSPFVFTFDTWDGTSTYTYFQIVNVSGNWSVGPWNYEVEFKIGGGTPGFETLLPAGGADNTVLRKTGAGDYSADWEALGTAADANVQTDFDDDTVDAVLINGSWGVGGDAVLITGDWDNPNRGQFFTNGANGALSNAPAAYTAMAAINIPTNSNTSFAQIAARCAGGVETEWYVRSSNGNLWNTWRQLWHEGNLTVTTAGKNLLDDTTVAAQRTTLGLTIGTDVQAYHAALQSISGLTTSANQMIYTTGSNLYATTALTAAGRALLDDADASAQRTTLGLAIGTNVQAHDADLATFAGWLTATDPTVKLTAPTDDITVELDKSATADDAAIEFSVGTSNRARLGLIADDDLTLKVSSDGTVYNDAMTVANSTGVITFPQGLILGGGTDVLDVLDEGTWTPVLNFGGGTTGITYSTQSGVYTKVNDWVTAQAALVLTSKGTDVGSAEISGLPFTIASDGQYYPALFIAVGGFSGLTNPVGRTKTGTTIQLLNQTSSNLSVFGDGVFTNTSNMKLTVIYKAA